MTNYHTFFIAIVALLTSTTGASAADQSGPSAADQTHITEAIRSFFAAAATDDLDKLAPLSLLTFTLSRPEDGLPARP